MRLGEALIESGHIDAQQLEKALNGQLIFGGHLGTCLIEMGYVDEETLGNLLSQVYGVSYAHRDLLDDIQPQVLQTLSQALVEKHLAIPFNLVKRTLRVAMVNPGNVPSLDELYFVSGLRIEPWVSPEVRVFQAMERYYQVPRRVRYIALARSLDEKRQKATVKRAAKAVQAVAAAASGTAHGAAPLVQLVPARITAEEAEPADPAVRPAGGRPGAAPDLEARLAHLAEELCLTDEVGPAVRIVVDHVAAEAARCVLFGVKNKEAYVRDLRGFAIDALAAHKLRFDVSTEPLLTLLSGEEHYQGPVPDQEKFEGFFSGLRTKVPQEILVMPVHRHDRLVALLYADSGDGKRIEGSGQGILRAMRKFSHSLDLIEIRQRIRSA